ncbi:hypothetical protein LTR36_000617 [Oleoguttula mirabilis]|uniref:SMP-30/Gluconolactonase/LRE-like region domain-containing protein n=1 Tax=Oleoguttula mirabilis TaxID=1507867 RepID=A0AAV9JQ90_9PEZI|nr:hypothetical protein LTR36_000617 [Oleoguttula mirabilis]
MGLHDLLFGLPAILVLVNFPVQALTGSALLLDSSVTYLLPLGFQGNVSDSFVSTNAGVGRPNDTAPLEAAAKASFVAFDEEFLDLLPPNASLELVAQKPYPFADEMGVWVWSRNEVWFTGPTINGSNHLTVLNLDTMRVYEPKTSLPVVNPNGGYYHEGVVYVAADGNATSAPAIYGVDPDTGEAWVVVDSYFGLRLNGPNDVTWTNNGKASYMFFTDDPLSSLYNDGLQPQLPDAVWRFDPQQKTLLPVIDRSDISVPNGIRVNKEGTKLYVTSTPEPYYYGANGTASSAIYVFDLDQDGFPRDQRLFGLAQRGISDGLHIDDSGRVWTGEADGIVVRSSNGKILGFLNAMALLDAAEVEAGYSLQNFALAGDKVVILALDKIWVLQLTTQIVKCGGAGQADGCLS